MPTAIDAATTGPDGRFRLAGIGRDRIAEMLISGPTIATAQLYVLNRDGPAIRDRRPRCDDARAIRTIYHARRFEYAAAPTRPIEGVIRDKDTGRPIAGLMLQRHGLRRAQPASRPRASRRRPTPRATIASPACPRRPPIGCSSSRARACPTQGDLPGAGRLARAGAGAFDIALKRGVLVRGRVTDKATGRPVSGYVNAYTFADNPHVGEFPGYRASYESYAYSSRTTAGTRSSPCRAAASSPAAPTWAATAAASAPRRSQGYRPQAAGSAASTRCRACATIADYHVLAEVDLDPKAESATLDLQVDPGRTLTVTVVDPEGKPIGGTKATGLTDLFSTIDYEQESPTIEIHALDPSKPRRVTITHDGRKLVGSRLPQGGRDRADDRPAPALGHDHRPHRRRRGPAPRGPGTEQPRRHLSGAARRPGHPAREQFEPGRPGRPRRPVPRRGPGPRPQVRGIGREGYMYIGEVFRDVTVAPGEVKDLGDLKVVPPRQDNP